MLSEALQSRGWYTALSGKWHAGHAVESALPHRRGFNSSLGNYGHAVVSLPRKGVAETTTIRTHHSPLASRPLLLRLIARSTSQDYYTKVESEFTETYYDWHRDGHVAVETGLSPFRSSRHTDEDRPKPLLSRDDFAAARLFPGSGRADPAAIEQPVYSSDAIADEAVRVIDEFADAVEGGGKEADAPAGLFLYVAFNAAHDPLQVSLVLSLLVCSQFSFFLPLCVASSYPTHPRTQHATSNTQHAKYNTTHNTHHTTHTRPPHGTGAQHATTCVALGAARSAVSSLASTRECPQSLTRSNDGTCWMSMWTRRVALPRRLSSSSRATTEGQRPPAA